MLCALYAATVAAAAPQECVALLTDSGFLSILHYDATQAR